MSSLNTTVPCIYCGSYHNYSPEMCRDMATRPIVNEQSIRLDERKRVLAEIAKGAEDRADEILYDIVNAASFQYKSYRMAFAKRIVAAILEGVNG